jgi:hypothetical protein
MKLAILHDRSQESIEAKTRWFKSLSIADRIDVFCSFTDLVLSVNPKLADRRFDGKDRNHAQPVAGRIQILTTT